MIPKIIHYCLFDRDDKKPQPRLVEDCIASWKKYCPDWEIRLWSEENFDVSLNDFTREAYEAGKLGFVPDYIRAYLIYTYGGIYLDTDLELLQNIDFLLENRAFAGNENNYEWGSWLGAAITGGEKGHAYFKAVMDAYEKQHFVNPDGSLNMWCTSNYMFSNVMQDMYGKPIPKEAVFDGMTLYAKNILYPHNREHVRPETVSIHHCTASWVVPVSVVMPAYNAEKTVAEAVESILNQTFERFEPIIIDDGSTDSTRDIIKSFKDRRIVLIENVHGFTGSLNLGMRRATGKYIARMDADDIMLPEWLRIQYDYMESHPDVDLLGAGMQFFDGGNCLYSPADTDVTPQDMLQGNCMAHPAVMIRGESLKKLPKLYRKEYVFAEDYDLWLRMLEAGMKLHNISDTVLRYRVSASQVTAARQPEVHETACRIRERYKPELTVIIPFLNEGIEVERTVLSIRQTAFNPDIILINDASDDGYEYDSIAERYGCRYVKHTERRGVAASRDEGVAMCGTEYFLLLDAHMEFYKTGWDLQLCALLRENPRSILCCQTKTLWESRENAPEKPATFGAYLSLNRKDILKCTWNSSDPDPDSPVVEIPVILGAAYAARKDYWQHLHGLKGLINYGMDEELISLKCRIEGGKCLLLKDIVVGHIYRSKFPYRVDNGFVLKNKLLIVEMFFEGEAKRIILERLRAYYGETFFNEVSGQIDRALIESERAIDKRKRYGACPAVIYGFEINSCYSNYFESRGKKIKVDFLSVFRKKMDIIEVKEEKNDGNG